MRSNVTVLRPDSRDVQNYISQSKLNTLTCAIAKRTLRPLRYWLDNGVAHERCCVIRIILFVDWTKERHESHAKPKPPTLPLT